MKTLLLIFIQKTLEIMMNDLNALSTDCSRETELEMKELFNCLFHTHIDDTHFQVKCCIQVTFQVQFPQSFKKLPK